MTKTITHDDVLRYIYKETSVEETEDIENMLLMHTSIMDFYAESLETIRKVQELYLEPSVNFQDKILDYSGSFKFESIS
jgi:hypothetical protein